MKNKFLALVMEAKRTGIADILCNTTNSEELKTAWQKFESENSWLFQKVEAWVREYNGEVLFYKGEKLENPIEIAAIIRIIGDARFTEGDFFETFYDLSNEIKIIPRRFAKGLASCMYDDWICDITAEEIFVKANVVED